MGVCSNRRRFTPLAVPALMVALSMGAQAQVPNRQGWLEDFQQLQQELSAHYANLEWAVQQRGVNLPQLREKTEERLRQAKSEKEAQRALDSFLEAFGDGHLEIQWSTGESGGAEPGSAPLCQRMGYAAHNQRAWVNWALFPEFEPIHDADAQDFPGGVLRLAGGRTFGVVQISLFSEYGHPGLCAQAQQKLGLADNAACDDKCEDRLELEVSNLLTAALGRRIESLERAGARRLLVDITRNGGGTNWSEPAARVLTKVPLRSPRLGFVRHEHWVKLLGDRLQGVEADLRDNPGADKATLETAAQHLRAAAAEAKKPCDRSGLWQDPPKSPDCPLLVPEPLYASGILPYAAPGSFSALRSKSVLFYPSLYSYREGVNRLPLLVLVDDNTASSAEYFAAMLQDNKAAKIVGMVTFGAGCGFTDGGIPTVLRHSGARVRIPDCARFRADGSNEVAGVIPDVLLPWSDKDSSLQVVTKLRRWLETLPAAPK